MITNKNLPFPPILRNLVPILLIFSCQALAQPKYDIQKVLNDINFSCNDEYFRTGINFKFKEICESQNIIEIRLFVMHSFGRHDDNIILAFDGNNWRYKKGRTNELFFTSQDSVKYAKLSQTLNDLIDNNIFGLPDQSEIKLPYEMIVWDGVSYAISYKVEDRFRIYSFNNPQDFANEFKNITEFRNFCNIVTLLKDISK